MLGWCRGWCLGLGLGLMVGGCVGCSSGGAKPPVAEQPQTNSPQVPPPVTGVPLSPLEQLGKNIFFDTTLSEPPGQACAVCHAPDTGWTGPNEDLNKAGAVYEGAVAGRFGNRKPPSVAYATQSPVLGRPSGRTGGFRGGLFWDGRATGEKLGSPAADQAQGPFLNPLEQNNPNGESVSAKVCGSSYANLFKQVFGQDACNDLTRAYDDIARAIAAYEASAEVNAFSSKYDAVLAGKATLTAEEQRGLELFQGKAKCDNCHVSRRGPNGEPPLFTDYTYDNLGAPRNAANPFYTQPPEFNPQGAAFVDPGLGGTLAARQDTRQDARGALGQMRVPTLRNVDKRPQPGFVKAYLHNGVFKRLETVVHFYNTRDALPLCPTDGSGKVGEDCWPAPEEGLNVNTREVGNLGLSTQEEADLVAFLRTLSDGFKP